LEAKTQNVCNIETDLEETDKNYSETDKEEDISPSVINITKGYKY